MFRSMVLNLTLFYDENHLLSLEPYVWSVLRGHKQLWVIFLPNRPFEIHKDIPYWYSIFILKSKSICSFFFAFIFHPFNSLVSFSCSLFFPHLFSNRKLPSQELTKLVSVVTKSPLHSSCMNQSVSLSNYFDSPDSVHYALTQRLFT